MADAAMRRRLNAADPINVIDFYDTVGIFHDPVHTGEDIANHPSTIVQEDVDPVNEFYSTYFEGREELRVEMCVPLLRIVLSKEKLASHSLTSQAVLDRLIDVYGTDEIQWHLIQDETRDVLRVRVFGYVKDMDVMIQEEFYNNLRDAIFFCVEFYPTPNTTKRTPLGEIHA